MLHVIWQSHLGAVQSSVCLAKACWCRKTLRQHASIALARFKRIKRQSVLFQNLWKLYINQPCGPCWIWSWDVLRCLDTLMEVFQPLPLGGLDSAAPLRMSLRSEIGFTCLKCVKVCHANLRHNPWCKYIRIYPSIYPSIFVILVCFSSPSRPGSLNLMQVDVVEHGVSRWTLDLQTLQQQQAAEVTRKHPW